jgi:hypothetical protein
MGSVETWKGQATRPPSPHHVRGLSAPGRVVQPPTQQPDWLCQDELRSAGTCVGRPDSARLRGTARPGQLGEIPRSWRTGWATPVGRVRRWRPHRLYVLPGGCQDRREPPHDVGRRSTPSTLWTAPDPCTVDGEHRTMVRPARRGRLRLPHPPGSGPAAPIGITAVRSTMSHPARGSCRRRTSARQRRRASTDNGRFSFRRSR